MDMETAPLHLDVSAFAQAGQRRAGTESLARYARIREETQGRGQDLTLQWAAQGETRSDALGKRQNWLHLAAQTTVPLVCQRCLDLVEVPLQVDRWFRFVADEATAAVEDDEVEEDLLVASADFNLHELIEDELILELPLIPRHEVCPSGPLADASDPDASEPLEEARPHPFAALARLKKPPTD